MTRATVLCLLLSSCAVTRTVERVDPPAPADMRTAKVAAGGAVLGMILAFVIVGAAGQNRTAGRP